MDESKPKTVAFPSHFIGIEEEFLAAYGAYVENHEIKSSVFGELFIDRENYRAQVFPLSKTVLTPKVKDSIIGIIDVVHRDSMSINVYYLNGHNVQPAYSAIMHVSDASKEYMKELEEYYYAGDIIRATVIDAKSLPIQVECRQSNTGVIYTMCLKCGSSVEKIKRDLLECKECGYKQQRKTAIDFGKVSLIT